MSIILQKTNAERLAGSFANGVIIEESDTGDIYLKITSGWSSLRIGGAGLVTDPNIIYLIDNTTTAGYTYFGSAPSGTATSAASWVMSKMTNATGNTYPVTGGGLAIWDNRATSVTYS